MLSNALNMYEADRIAALRSYAVLDTAEEKDFDELTLLASAICQAPISLISLVEEKRQWFKSRNGIDIDETPIEQSFCKHAITDGNEIMIVSDAKEDVRFTDNPFVTGPANVVFYAGVPLVNEDGFSLGTLCVIDHFKRDLTAEQLMALKVLGRQVMDKLEIRRKVAALEKRNKELLESNVLIQKFASMAAHDIKNPLGNMLLASQVLKTRIDKIEDSGCEKLIDLNIMSNKKLIVLVEEMLAYSESPSLLITKKHQVELNEVLERIITLVKVPDGFELRLPSETYVLKLSIVAFEQIMINLLTNAFRYNDKESGCVEIRFKESNDFYLFEVQDNGIGIPEEYHQKIFNSNFTLNVTDRYNQLGTGIGLSTVQSLIDALGGTIEVQSVLNSGTTIFFSLKK